MRKSTSSSLISVITVFALISLAPTLGDGPIAKEPRTPKVSRCVRNVSQEIFAHKTTIRVAPTARALAAAAEAPLRAFRSSEPWSVLFPLTPFTAPDSFGSVRAGRAPPIFG